MLKSPHLCALQHSKLRKPHLPHGHSKNFLWEYPGNFDKTMFGRFFDWIKDQLKIQLNGFSIKAKSLNLFQIHSKSIHNVSRHVLQDLQHVPLGWIPNRAHPHPLWILTVLKSLAITPIPPIARSTMSASSAAPSSRAAPGASCTATSCKHATGHGMLAVMQPKLQLQWLLPRDSNRLRWPECPRFSRCSPRRFASHLFHLWLRALRRLPRFRPSHHHQS